jgi:CRISPR-associated protein Cmr2
MSTGHLAAWPALERMGAVPVDLELHKAMQRYLAMLGELGVPLEEQEVVGQAQLHPILGPYDGGLLYENRVPDLFEFILDEDDRRQRISRARDALSKATKRLGIGELLPYYSILIADGDRMGKAIEQQETPEAHQKLSQALDGFARNAAEIVEKKHRGELIYSGGDDVLAFVPLHRAIECARALAEDFGRRLTSFPTAEGKPPTLSVGIGISHFLEPMGHALDVARKAEGLAKETRNALAVIVDKRSGAPVQVSGVWGTLDQELAAFITLHREDEIPDGAAFELEQLGHLLAGDIGDKKKALSDLVRAEAERILRRKQPAHGKKKELAPEVLEQLRKALDEHTPEELARRLIVARLLAKAWEQATPPTAQTEEGGEP